MINVIRAEMEQMEPALIKIVKIIIIIFCRRRLSLPGNLAIIITILYGLYLKLLINTENRN